MMELKITIVADRCNPDEWVGTVNDFPEGDRKAICYVLRSMATAIEGNLAQGTPVWMFPEDDGGRRSGKGAKLRLLAMTEMAEGQSQEPPKDD